MTDKQLADVVEATLAGLPVAECIMCGKLEPHTRHYRVGLGYPWRWFRICSLECLAGRPA